MAASVSSCCTNRCAAPPSSNKEPHSSVIIAGRHFHSSQVSCAVTERAAYATMATTAAALNMTSVGPLLSILDHNTERTMTGSVEN